MKKKLIALVLALAMALGMLPASAAANPFTDMTEKYYYYDAVMWAYESGVTTGISATEFGPYDYCTRGQVVTFLWRAAGKPEPTGSRNPFTDVKSTDYFYKAVLWAVENGITTGTTATTFSPENQCLKSEVVTFLWRAAGKPSASASGTKAAEFKDSDYFKTAVAWGDRKGMFDRNNKFFAGARAYRSDIVYEMYLAREELTQSVSTPTTTPTPTPTPTTDEDSVVSVDVASIPTPEDGHATAYIDGVKYDMLAKKDGDLSAPTMELFFDDYTPNTHWCEPTIQVGLGFHVNDEKGKTIGVQYSIWYWDMWKLADEEEIGVSRYGNSSYGTLKTDPYDPSGESPSVFEICMTVEDEDGGIHEIVIKAKCTVTGLVSQYNPSTGTTPGGGFTPIGSTRCSGCGGSGRCTSGCKNGRVYYPTYGTDMPGWTLCPICRGTGDCTKCGGSGKGN